MSTVLAHTRLKQPMEIKGACDEQPDPYMGARKPAAYFSCAEGASLHRPRLSRLGQTYFMS